MSKLHAFITTFMNAVITFELSEPEYRAVEDGEFANVTISKKQGFTLANPVTFRITPLTVQQALDQGIIDFYPTPENENVSPSRAGELYIAIFKTTHPSSLHADTADFNTTVFEVVFPSDASLSLSLGSVCAAIGVEDDTKDEADEQFFIAHLELADAVNPNTIVIAREWATIIIVDNDGKE